MSKQSTASEPEPYSVAARIESSVQSRLKQTTYSPLLARLYQTALEKPIRSLADYVLIVSTGRQKITSEIVSILRSKLMEFAETEARIHSLMSAVADTENFKTD